jgi:trehalose 6-phosphate synthase
MTRLIAVSNRVAKPSGDNKSAGGLAVGVNAALEEYGGLWFGWNGKTIQGEPGDPRLEKDGKVTYATIDLNENSYELYYNGFSNTSLWPVCHYLLGFYRYDQREYDEYRNVNALFAGKLLPLLQPDDVIWVHDYHLIPLAAELRRAGVTQPIGFFLHVPFPDIEVFRVLPVYQQLLRALCAYDVVGFHTQRDLRSFEEAVTQIEIGGIDRADRRKSNPERTAQAGVFPIGIDVPSCRQLAVQAIQTRSVARMTHGLHQRQQRPGRTFSSGRNAFRELSGEPESGFLYSNSAGHTLWHSRVHGHSPRARTGRWQNQRQIC